MKKCTGCQVEKELCDFARKHNIYATRCKACAAKYAKKWRESHLEECRSADIALRNRIAELKTKPCVDCGGTFPSCCMDFDHVRGKKLFQISQSVTRSWKTILEEIAKCDLVCSNCHRVRTYSRKVTIPKGTIPRFGQTRSEEFCSRMSEKQKQFWADPIYRKMMLDARLVQSA